MGGAFSKYFHWIIHTNSILAKFPDSSGNLPEVTKGAEFMQSLPKSGSFRGILGWFGGVPGKVKGLKVGKYD